MGFGLALVGTPDEISLMKSLALKEKQFLTINKKNDIRLQLRERMKLLEMNPFPVYTGSPIYVLVEEFTDDYVKNLFYFYMKLNIVFVYSIKSIDELSESQKINTQYIAYVSRSNVSDKTLFITDTINTKTFHNFSDIM